MLDERTLAERYCALWIAVIKRARRDAKRGDDYAVTWLNELRSDIASTTTIPLRRDSHSVITRWKI